jgi:hypothetical protein
MSDLSNNPVSPRPEDDKPYSQKIAHQPVSARVPEKVSRGVLSTGQLVLDSPKEFCIDFLFGIARPFQVVSRVIVTPQTMQELATALEQNLNLYQQNFGSTPTSPSPVNPPPPQRPTIQEIYEHFKVSDEISGGAYANSVMISHNATEYCFDFIAGFYPTSVVTSRVLMSAPVAPKFLGTLKGSIAAWRNRQTPPPTPPPTPPSDSPSPAE